jgi:hypothetical protein
MTRDESSRAHYLEIPRFALGEPVRLRRTPERGLPPQQEEVVTTERAPIRQKKPVDGVLNGGADLSLCESA